MKKNNWILLFILLTGIVGCQDAPKQIRVENHPSMVTDTSKNSVNRILEEKPFSNPAIIYGSDFLSFLSTLKMTSPGNLDTLLYFTSKESIERLGNKGVIHYYEKTNINFRKKLKAVRKVGDRYYLSYVGHLTATRQNIVFEVRIENDTCRLVIK